MAIPLAGVLMPALAKVGAVKLPLLLRGAGIAAGAAPGGRRSPATDARGEGGRTPRPEASGDGG